MAFIAILTQDINLNHQSTQRSKNFSAGTRVTVIDRKDVGDGFEIVVADGKGEIYRRRGFTSRSFAVA